MSQSAGLRNLQYILLTNLASFTAKIPASLRLSLWKKNMGPANVHCCYLVFYVLFVHKSEQRPLVLPGTCLETLRLDIKGKDVVSVTYQVSEDVTAL